jgi:hypothetical protein
MQQGDGSFKIDFSDMTGAINKTIIVPIGGFHFRTETDRMHKIAYLKKELDEHNEALESILKSKGVDVNTEGDDTLIEAVLLLRKAKSLEMDIEDCKNAVIE